MIADDLSQKPYLTLTEYCKYYNVGDDLVRRLIKNNQLPGVLRIGGRYKIPRDSVPPDAVMAPGKATPASPEDEEMTKKRKELEQAEFDVRLLKTKREKAELEGTLLKGEELAKRETEIAEMQAEAERKLALADDRERQLNEQEARLGTAQGQDATALAEEKRRLTEWDQILEERAKELQKQESANKAEAERIAKSRKELETHGKTLDGKEQSLQQKSHKLSEDLNDFQLDVAVVAKVVSAFMNGSGKEQKEAMKEFKEWKWRTLNIEW